MARIAVIPGDGAGIEVAQAALPVLSPTGSITFVSAVSGSTALPGTAAQASVYAAIEALVPVLAVELGPRRVNAVSPGWVNTSIWRDVAGDQADAMLATMARTLPAGRIGRPEDIAHALSFVLGNGFATGTVVHVDGGHRLA